MTSATLLETLDPQFRPIAKAILDTCAAKGLDLVVTDALRDRRRQQELWAQGRKLVPGSVDVWEEVGSIVTRARPGQSPHEFGLAIDCCPRALLKLPGWAPESPLWRVYGEVVRKCGAKWGGDFLPVNGRSLVDLPHAEIVDWHRYARAATP